MVGNRRPASLVGWWVWAGGMRLPWYESCPYILLGRHLHDSKIPWGLGKKITRNICWRGKQLPTPPPSPSFSALKGCRPGQGSPTPAAPTPPAGFFQTRKEVITENPHSFHSKKPCLTLHPTFFFLIKAKMGGQEGHGPSCIPHL